MSFKDYRVFPYSRGISRDHTPVETSTSHLEEIDSGEGSEDDSDEDREDTGEEEQEQGLREDLMVGSVDQSRLATSPTFG